MPEGLDHFPSKPLRPQLRRDTPIEDLDLPVRAFGRIYALGVKTLHELALVDPATLLGVSGFGKKSLNDVAVILEDYLHGLGAAELSAYTSSLPRWLPYFANRENLWLALESERAKARLGNARWRVENLPLSASASDCLTRAGVKDVRELALRFPTEIRSFSHFGDKVLTELTHYIKEYFASLGDTASSLYARTYDSWLRYARKPFVVNLAKPASLEDIRDYSPSLPDLIKHFLAQQGSKNGEILVRRFGLAPGTRAQTLAAVGRDFGLTRERIRQIAAKARARFAKLVRRTRPDLTHRLREYLDQVKVATISQISNEIPDFACHGEFVEIACIRLTLEDLSPSVRSLDPAAVLWTSCNWIKPDFYGRVVRTASRVLGGIPVELERLALETARRVGSLEDADIEVIRRIVEATPGVFTVQMSDRATVVLPTRQNLVDLRRAFAYDYIKEQGVPIHLSEIFEAMQEMQPSLIPQPTTPRTALQVIRSSLERDERFAWAGQSTFGLREWGYETGVTSIGGAALQLLRSAGKPLAISELWQALNQLYRINLQSVTAALNAEKGKRVAKDSEGRWVALR